MRPWTAVISRYAPPPTPSFNGATALRPWTAMSAARRSATASGFNGATALRPWTAAPLAGFVVAVVVLQWGHGLAAVDGRDGA